MPLTDVLSYKYAPSYMKTMQDRVYKEAQAKKMAEAADKVYGMQAQPAVTPYAEGTPQGIGALLPQEAKPATGVFDVNVPTEQRYNALQKRMVQSGLQGFLETAMANAQGIQSSVMANYGAYQRSKASDIAKGKKGTDDIQEYDFYTEQTTANRQQPMSFLDWQIKMRKASVPPGETDPFLVAHASKQATMYDEMAKSAVSGIDMMNNLSVMKSVQDDSIHGGLAEAGKLVGNLLASVGVDQDWITATNLTDRSSNDILRQYMVKLGARGLTDKDMDILRSSLPTFRTDIKAQSEVIRILEKGIGENITDYKTMSKRLRVKYPNNYFALHPAVERYQKQIDKRAAARAKYLGGDK